MNMFQDDAAELLEKKGADKDHRGRVIVPEHIPKASIFWFISFVFSFVFFLFPTLSSTLFFSLPHSLFHLFLSSFRVTQRLCGRNILGRWFTALGGRISPPYTTRVSEE
jgi:hypothetical protein